MQHNKQYQLGSWKVCPISNTLFNQIDSHSIDDKTMQVLLLLIAHKGQPVSKTQLLEQVWQGKVVSDDILSVTVSKIRKALNDNARSPTFIKTLSGKGYVLIADVCELDRQETTLLPDATAGSKRLSLGWLLVGLLMVVLTLLLGLFLFYQQDNSAHVPDAETFLNIQSIAVLPFDDLSSVSDNKYFTDGLSDSIIHQLSQINSLKVISRNSSFAYRDEYRAVEIGKALGVDTLLDGSVQKVENRVRINVRIFSTVDGAQLWSETFDEESSEIFALQDKISNSIKRIIRPEQPVNQPKVRQPSAQAINSQAYEWYLMGQYLWRQRNPASLEQAVTWFKKSLELEPEYVEAHIGLAVTYEFLHTYGNWDEKRSIDSALPHINKALEIDPNSSRALAAKGLVLTELAVYQINRGQADPELYLEAQQAFLQSLALDDNAMTHQWYSNLLRRMGNDNEAVEHMSRAVELNPLSGALKRSFSFNLLGMGKFDSAQRMFHQSLQLEPEFFSKPVESIRINRYSKASVTAILTMYKQTPEVFAECSSVEYCEHLVFALLSIGADDLASKILINMGPTHFHFRTSLNSIAASRRADELQALRVIEPFAQWNTLSKRLRYDYAVAQYRAGEFQGAQESLLSLYPQWQNAREIALRNITPDNYKAMLLYAAILAELSGEDSNGHELLHKLLAFLEQDLVFDKAEAEFTRSEINALLNNNQQALFHLAAALQLGWMESFNKEWWTLENNHYLSPLTGESKFLQLLHQHNTQRRVLRELATST